MPNQSKKSHHSFTVEYPAKQRAIVTSCKVSDPLDLSITPFEGRALWDTGATSTVVNTKISSYLNLVPVGRRIARGIHSSAPVNRYIVNIELLNGVTSNSLAVVEANLGDDIDVLIGMDIIGAGDFAICGSTFFSFATPTLDNPVDFVEKSNSVNR